MTKDTASTAQIYAGYQGSAAGRLRVALAQHNLRTMHRLNRPLRVLDAGGGDGVNTAYFADRGCSVTFLDGDPEMLALARARVSALADRCHFIEGSLDGIAELVTGVEFDLILCHHVLEYLKDAGHMLRALGRLAAPSCELSLITINPVSEVMRAVLFGRNAALAQSKVTDRRFDAKWFGDATLYSQDEVIALAEASGWRFKDFRGIRVLADYLPEDGGSPARPAKEEEVVKLEERLSALEPYRRIGRYLQFSFVRT